ncbi:MAG: HEAT repeat domain-containing protein, partial [Planctomycetales bacterium]|nr:HEAT repeat domain-containing protein [Planctomycetales bacterium]
PAQSKSSWEEWWTLNKWEYTSTGRRGATITGAEGGSATGGEERGLLTKFLVECLKHEYFDIRSAAALALGKAGDKSAVPELIKLLKDSNPDVREGAAIALGILKDPEVIAPLVKEVLENPETAKDSRLRSCAAMALGFIGDKAATTPLIEVYNKNTKDFEVRAAAIAGLGLLKDESAVPNLYQIMTSAGLDDQLRAYAASALGKCGFKEFTIPMAGGKAKTISVVDKLLELLYNERSDQIRQSCVLALGPLGDEKQFEAVYKILQGDKDQMVQNFATMVLPRLAKTDKLRAATLEALSRVLTGRNHSGRGFGALAIGLLGEPTGAAALRKSFHSESDPSIREACALGLGLLKDKSFLSELQGAIMGTSDAKLRGYCCLALGMIGDREAVPVLQDVLKQAMTPEVKAAAAIALSQIGDRQAIPILVEMLKDKSGYVKNSTVVALGYFRDLSTVKALRECYDDIASNNETKAIVIASGLGYIVDRFERPILKQLAIDFNYTLGAAMVGRVMRWF